MVDVTYPFLTGVWTGMIEIFLAGGPVMYPLLLCSLIAVAIIIERTIFWWQHKNARHPELIAELCNDTNNGKQTITDGISHDLIARILIKGIRCPRSEASWRMQLAAEQEWIQVSRYLIILSTMVTLTPLLGIFGTVLGVIESFQLLGDPSVIDPLSANSGLAQALITTAYGLGIAMVSLIATKIFNTQSAKLRDELETCCTELELALSLTPSSQSA